MELYRMHPGVLSWIFGMFKNNKVVKFNFVDQLFYILELVGLAVVPDIAHKDVMRKTD